MTEVTSNYSRLNNLFHLLKAIRIFFEDKNFLDVMTPPAVSNPGMETHIHPFRLKSALLKKDINYYLHTSPEFHMKELLSYGFENIFTLVYCFRDEPDTEIHRNQFIMLEWYRVNSYYTKIMEDAEKLIDHCLSFFEQKNIKINIALKSSKRERATVSDLFVEYLKFDILNFLDKTDLYEKIKKDFKDVPLPPIKHLSWDDIYFLIFLNKIEPHFKNIPYLLLYEYPYHLSALSTLKETDKRVCERFEIYLNGIEICNCFNELTDLKAQKERFKLQEKEKQELYSYTLPKPNILYKSLGRGLPKSAGIALGVERFLKSLILEKNPFY